MIIGESGLSGVELIVVSGRFVIWEALVSGLSNGGSFGGKFIVGEYCVPLDSIIGEYCVPRDKVAAGEGDWEGFEIRRCPVPVEIGCPY